MASNLPTVLAEIEALKRAKLEATGIVAVNHIRPRTPVLSGRLRASYTYEVVGNDAVRVGTNVEYGPFVELGTRNQNAQPHMVPGVIGAKSAIQGIWST